MNIRVQQLNPVIGDLEGNKAVILNALEKAEEAGIDLLILPELCTCGYSPLDLLQRDDFLNAVVTTNETIIAKTRKTALVFGSVSMNDSQKGMRCFNAALMAQDGALIAKTHKTLLPTYDVFDEKRYFEPNDQFKCVTFKGTKLGLTICEDIWFGDSSVQEQGYKTDPLQKLADLGAEALINISASPFTIRKSENRQRMLKRRAQAMNLPIFYANQAGGNTELISDGDSMVLNGSGEIMARAELFKAAFIDVAWDPELKALDSKSSATATIPSKTERVFGALCHGLKDYMAKTGAASEAIIGLSGGIDSALVVCIAVEALGAENVCGVAMPSDFSTEGSVTDARELADNLKIKLHELPIKSIYEEYLRALKPLFRDSPFGAAEENIQSRARGMLLMAISNKLGGLVLNTGNKSELAVGYCTLYGDMNGALGIISDLYKTEVYEMAHWLNDAFYKKEIIPNTTLTKPPSAELRPDQKDTDSLPEYDTLDDILKCYIEKQMSVVQITQKGFDESVVSRITALVDQNDYKRFQAAPGLKVHDKAFGTGRRQPLAQKWTKNIV